MAETERQRFNRLKEAKDRAAAGGTISPTISPVETPRERLGRMQSDRGTQLTTRAVSGDTSPSWLQRVSDRLGGRKQEVEAGIAREAAGEQTAFETVGQLIGKGGFGSAWDIASETLSSAGQFMSAITPDPIEEKVKTAAVNSGLTLLHMLAGPGAVENISEGMDQYQSFAQENPRAAANIESVMNIGMFYTPKGVKITPRGNSAIERGAERLALGAREQTLGGRRDFIDDLVLPFQSATERRTRAGYGTTEEMGGILNQKKPILNSSEKRSAKEVMTIPEVKPTNTYQGNLAAIESTVYDEAAILKKKLSNNDFTIPKEEFSEILDGVRLRIQDHPDLRGRANPQARHTATNYVDDAQRIMDDLVGDGDVTGSALLQARKDLDNRIMSSPGGKKVLDPNDPIDSAKKMAQEEIRKSIYDVIERNAPNIGVRNTNRRLHNLLNGADNVRVKAGKEAPNRALRLWARAKKVLEVRGTTAQFAGAAVGVGAFTAMTTMAMPFLQAMTAGGILYLGGKAVMGPGMKRALSGILSAADKAIKVSKDKDVINQLRADRIILREMLRTAEDE